MKKLLSLVLALAMILTMAMAASAETIEDLPRNETMYFGGNQWGPVISWNPISSTQNNWAIYTPRELMYETLYMYNLLDGQLYPLLADGDYVWNDDLTEMTVKLKEAAKWSDGKALTAEDVVATWDACVYLQNSSATAYQAYISSIEATDEHTIVIKCVLTEDGKPANPLQVLNYLAYVYVCQKDWIDEVFARNDNDVASIMNDPEMDSPYSGPYGRYYDDDRAIVLVRNDEYWGQDESMWGKLPVPKYVSHPLLVDNDAVTTAFIAGQLDVCQNFFANVQNFWEEQDLPISTYMDEAPYGICTQMPTAFYNMEIPVLAENPALRKAIAIAVDYDDIIENAMTNQSPSFADAPRSVMNPTEGEQAMYDHDAVADLQWVGKDIEGAKALLDEAGIVDTDGDGYREWNGEKIELNAVCPNGWNDWQAAIEIVAAAGQAIGIDITTFYPTWDVFQTVFTKAHQTEYDIFMYNSSSAEPSAPWSRVRCLLSSEFNEADNNWSGNWGHYSNPRADEIVAAIPLTTDPDELKALYTEATEIYLTDIPSFSLMYRPAQFHAVYEGVWTNFPEYDDGTNIPPTNCTDAYGIAALYNVELIED